MPQNEGKRGRGVGGKHEGTDGDQSSSSQSRKRRKRDDFLSAAATGPEVVIDLGWSSVLTAKEAKSLVQQVMYLYGENKRAPLNRPVSIVLVGLDLSKRGLIEDGLRKLPGFPDSWLGVRVDPRPLVEAFEGNTQTVVYLTSEAEEVLVDVQPGTSYVIGGIVDHNRLKGVTQNFARKNGVMSRKLPLRKYCTVKCSTVLTVNTVFSSLLYKYSVGSWPAAFDKALPSRKGKGFALKAEYVKQASDEWEQTRAQSQKLFMPAVMRKSVYPAVFRQLGFRLGRN